MKRRVSGLKSLEAIAGKQIVSLGLVLEGSWGKPLGVVKLTVTDVIHRCFCLKLVRVPLLLSKQQPRIL